MDGHEITHVKRWSFSLHSVPYALYYSSPSKHASAFDVTNAVLQMDEAQMLSQKQIPVIHAIAMLNPAHKSAQSRDVCTKEIGIPDLAVRIYMNGDQSAEHSRTALCVRPICGLDHSSATNERGRQHACLILRAVLLCDPTISSMYSRNTR